MHRTIGRTLLFAAASLCMVVPGSASAATTARSGVRGSAPTWATAARDRGAADDGQRVEITVYLPLRDPASAEALARQVSDPGSSSYGQHLSPDAFHAQFSPSGADVAAVRSFLTGAGLQVDDVSEGRTAIAASGTLAQVEQAFGVSVHRYAFRGRLLNAPTSGLTVPASLQGKILAVAGVDQSGTLTRPADPRQRGDDASLQRPRPDAPVRGNQAFRQPPHAVTGAPPPPAFVNAPPCSSYFGEKVATGFPKALGQQPTYAPCGYTPPQFQGAYGTAGAVAHGLDGRGVTVAITDAYAAPTILQDANTYAITHGQQPFRRNQFRQITPRRPYRYGYDDQVNGDVCGEQGWYGEETLDVEAVHAMAPGADVLYVAGRSCDDPDLLAALNKIVDRRLATIVTNSWGDVGEDVPADILQAYEQTFVQAAVEGIGMFFSSGDDGDDSTDTVDGSPAVDFPASNPWVTSVGGTALGVGRRNDYLGETGWATGTASLSEDGKSWEPAPPGMWLYGGGGGVSSLFDEPWYQQGVVPAGIAGGHRAMPDVAMDGDPQTGMLVGQTQTFPDGSVRYSEYRVGGTSLSSPLYAGIEALADQAGGRSHGFANPAIYRLDGTPSVHDVNGSGLMFPVVRVNYANGVDATDGTVPILRVLNDEAQSIHLGPRWDTITGVGTPNGLTYITHLGYGG